MKNHYIAIPLFADTNGRQSEAPKCSMTHMHEVRYAKNPNVRPDSGTGLYDVKRLAQLFDIKPATVRTLRQRHQLPPSLSDDINGGAVWDAKTIWREFDIPALDEKNDKTGDNSNQSAVIDLFAGCGGLSLGFIRAGFKVLAGYDNWDPAIRNYNHNLPSKATKLDLSDVKLVEDTIEKADLQFDGIIGGPPCQDFSSAGKREEGMRADLTERYAEIVTFFKPRFFLMENVARAKNAGAFKRAVTMLEECGYGVTKLVLNADRCNVPQSRKRLFTVGFYKDNVNNEFEKYLTRNLSEKPMTVRDYFGDSIDTEFYYRHPRSYARRGIFSIDEPSPTIRGVNRPIPKGYKAHANDAGPIDEARPLTTEERARIQTFENYDFQGSKTDQEQLIGNAVPVNLAAYVGKAINCFLHDTKEKKEED